MLTQISRGGNSTPADTGLDMLPEELWLPLRLRHERRIAEATKRQAERMSRGEKHPVYDFLFSYYSLRPGQLRRWHPGIGRAVAGESAEPFLQYREYRRAGEGVAADPRTLSQPRRDAVRWILSLLEATRDRPAHFGCFGLHEWAMVYRSDKTRHDRYPLRIEPEAVNAVVETLAVRCSHFDAFRFFTPDARPLNRLQPSREQQPLLDQRGCLHVNMDLYKWAYKLAPFTPSELVAETFLLAARIREVDMRASPYDLTALGFAAIRIETPEGRAEYEAHQRTFAAEGETLRRRLIGVCRRILLTLH